MLGPSSNCLRRDLEDGIKVRNQVIFISGHVLTTVIWMCSSCARTYHSVAVGTRESKPLLRAMRSPLRDILRGPDYANNDFAYQLPLLDQFCPHLREDLYHSCALADAEERLVNTFVFDARNLVGQQLSVSPWSGLTPVQAEHSIVMTELLRAIPAVTRASLAEDSSAQLSILSTMKNAIVAMEAFARIEQTARTELEEASMHSDKRDTYDNL
ncbi:hypothetical protein BC835DRAFT_1421332 [Cytidiella melzeri]|nr:hypothetical protein BC835DRAFT_1421332 [Cytidiella melzeri]